MREKFLFTQETGKKKSATRTINFYTLQSPKAQQGLVHKTNFSHFLSPFLFLSVTHTHIYTHTVHTERQGYRYTGILQDQAVQKVISTWYIKLREEMRKEGVCSTT